MVVDRCGCALIATLPLDSLSLWSENSQHGAGFLPVGVKIWGEKLPKILHINSATESKSNSFPYTNWAWVWIRVSKYECTSLLLVITFIARKFVCYDSTIIGMENYYFYCIRYSDTHACPPLRSIRSEWEWPRSMVIEQRLHVYARLGS